ncbi:unnamed protein product [Dovyalis caffra]|uniref:MATH domain-containing protein n=1 Tax=Dovyalis caffra TaxID=77055 RepID=A0AAV1RVF8_9ROSI|nr:unnamed protein product [Dovyalis caffra]
MHYSLKIESFSSLLKTKVEKYESNIFEAGGYKWRLCLYPNGNTKGNGKGFISLYLEIEHTSDLPPRWEVNAEFKLFVFDQIKNQYLTVQDSDGKSFQEMKTEWGFDKLVSLETFNDSSNGYLVSDCCFFGAEIFVIKPTGKWESLSIVHKPANGSLRWKIEVDGDKLPPKKTLWTEYKLRVLDQCRDKHVEKTVNLLRLSVYLIDDLVMSHVTYSAMKNNNICNSMSSGGLGTTRSKRDLPPMHYSLKIESFSSLLKTKVEKYESNIFEAGGYKWRLCLYPNGNTKGNGKGFISLYLEIENTSDLPYRWEVNAEFKLFVFDQINNQYLTVQDSDGKRFHEMKTEWGFDKLVSLETFNDTSNGRIRVYPKGTDEVKGDSLSIYLELVDGDKLPPKKTLWTEYILRVLNQCRDQHVEKSVSFWLTSSHHARGYAKFMPLGDLYEASKGYVMNDTLIVELSVKNHELISIEDATEDVMDNVCLPCFLKRKRLNYEIYSKHTNHENYIGS